MRAHSYTLLDAVPLPHAAVAVVVKAAAHLAVAFSALPRAGAPRTVCVRVVLVPNLVEELDLVLRREQRGCDRVHRRVAPALCDGE